jgi:SagB-type dehydrogenase family enzyme
MYTLHLGDPGEGSKELWSLREDVFVEPQAPDGSLTLYGQWGDVVLRGVSQAVGQFLHRMQLGPVALENVLGDPPGAAPTVAERAGLFVTLERLRHLIVRSLGAGNGDQPLVSVVPMSPRARFRVERIDPDRAVRLSVFAALTSDGTALTLESPLSLHRVVLHGPQAAWLAVAVGRAQTPAEAARLLVLPRELVFDLLAYLVAAGMVVQCEPDAAAGRPRFAEDHDPALRGWTRADLDFHVASTLGRHDHDFGATYPFGTESRPAALPELPQDGPKLPLHRPQLAELLADDPPFTAVLEARRSVRRFAASPPTLRELGDLLYRAVRIRSLIGPEGSGPELATTMSRPYPSGGAIHELDFYVVVNQCAGLERGVYAYDAMDHALLPIKTEPPDVDLLLEHARTASNTDGAPPVLIMITARFQRLFWKYAGIGYALTLKHVGVVQQTLYLVATAMGLASCAIGAGEIEESSRILRLDWLAQSCVGGFTVGLPPDPARPRPPRRARHPVNDAGWPDQCRASLGASRPAR